MDIDHDISKISASKDSMHGQLLHIPVGTMLKEDLFTHQHVLAYNNGGLHSVVVTPSQQQLTTASTLQHVTANSDIQHPQSRPKTANTSTFYNTGPANGVNSEQQQPRVRGLQNLVPSQHLTKEATVPSNKSNTQEYAATVNTPADIMHRTQRIRCTSTPTIYNNDRQRGRHQRSLEVIPTSKGTNLKCLQVIEKQNRRKRKDQS
ncbi:hypothetical protein Tco_0415342 [Tanacetum coccineum]